MCLRVLVTLECIHSITNADSIWPVAMTLNVLGVSIFDQLSLSKFVCPLFSSVEWGDPSEGGEGEREEWASNSIAQNVECESMAQRESMSNL